MRRKEVVRREEVVCRSTSAMDAPLFVARSCGTNSI